MRYKADMTVGALMVPESRIVAALLLGSVDALAWRKAIEADNVLQKRSAGSAMRMATLIRARLELMKPGLWRMVHDGSQVVATHATFAAAIRHSPLLGDFLDLIVRERFRRLDSKLPKQLWREFIAGCAERDPEMPAWSETTITKLRRTAFQTLAQVGYLDDTRSLALQRVEIAPEVMAYLRENHESYVLRCIEVTP